MLTSLFTTPGYFRLTNVQCALFSALGILFIILCTIYFVHREKKCWIATTKNVSLLLSTSVENFKNKIFTECFFWHFQFKKTLNDQWMCLHQLTKPLHFSESPYTMGLTLSHISRSEQAPGSEFHPRDKSEKIYCGFL